MLMLALGVPESLECWMASQPNILWIEQDAQSSAQIRQQLDRDGYHVLSLQGGKTGLNWLRGHLSDIKVALTDLIMPEVDGFALLGYVQEHAADLPVIIVTGETSLLSAIEAMRLGAYDFLLRPLNETVVQAVLARALERAKLLEQSRVRKRLEVVLEQAQKILAELEEPFQLLQQAAASLPMVVIDQEVTQDLHTIKQETERVKASLDQIGQITRYETTTYLGKISILDLDRSAPRPEKQEDTDVGKSDPGH
jgi:DNA-binding response OmpR family regulator